MPKALEQLKELIETGYQIEDVSSDDETVHVMMNNGSETLLMVVLEKQDAEAILRGDAAWLDEVADDFVL